MLVFRTKDGGIRRYFIRISYGIDRKACRRSLTGDDWTALSG